MFEGKVSWGMGISLKRIEGKRRDRTGETVKLVGEKLDQGQHK